MSANKLLRRIIKPKKYSELTTTDGKQTVDAARETHYATFGISSDPMMHFAMVFVALIHDVDHPGLTNDQLVKIKNPASVIYKGRSI
jgi:hypothetical protein